jgi:hypothetical protein
MNSYSLCHFHPVFSNSIAEAKREEKDVTKLQIGVKVGCNGFGGRPCYFVDILLFNCLM